MAQRIDELQALHHHQHQHHHNHNPERIIMNGMEAEAEDDAHDAIARPFRPDSDLSRVLNQVDPLRMSLTRDEHQRATQIKEMVEGLPDLDNLSDLMYVQLALVCQNNLEDAVNRCYAMQLFREEYGIVDTPEQGSRYLEWLVRLHPQHILHFSFSPADGTYVFVHDPDQFDPRDLSSAALAEDFLRAMYYCFLAFFPDVESIRKGVICVAECLNMTSMRSGVLKHFGNFFSQYLCHYPFIGQCRCYHTGAMVNVLVSMLKKILPKDLRSHFQVGLLMEDSLGSTFLTPTVEDANARAIARLQCTLAFRYQNEKIFSLGDYQTDS